MPVRLRHKIEKRGLEKDRKERRHAKKHPELHRKKPAALNIPNSYPYKDQILSEIEEARRIKAEDQVKRREDAKQRRKEQLGAGADDEEAMKDVDEESEDSEAEDDDMDVSDSEGEEEVCFAAARSGLPGCMWVLTRVCSGRRKRDGRLVGLCPRPRDRV